MAFTNFYLIAGGSGSADINAGSTIGAAQVTTVNGNWTSGTGVFIAASGTPFASTIVGDYASVYVDGATVTTFVGRVTTVTSNVNITVDVTTLKYGTPPSTLGTTRSCTINGSWNTEQVLAAGGLATTTAPQATKINIKGNLTIAASRVISMAGATTAPLWFSGYNTTPGDLDADTTNALAKPIWTLSNTFSLTTSGTFQTWSSVSVTGAISGALWIASGTNQKHVRCRSSNTSSNAAAVAFNPTQAGAIFSYCYYSTPTTATSIGTINIANTVVFIGCTANGGGLAGFNQGANSATYYNCLCTGNTGAGILATTGTINALGCTFYGATVDCIKWSSTPAGTIVGCMFSGLSGGAATTNGINNALGTNVNTVQRSCNDYYNVTNAEVGFSDSPAFFGQTDSVFPLSSATNFSPIGGSNASNHGFPGIFENQTFSSFQDIGAVEPLSGGGGVVNVGGSYVGGMADIMLWPA